MPVSVGQARAGLRSVRRFFRACGPHILSVDGTPRLHSWIEACTVANLLVWYYDEKVDTGCNSAARLVCCGPANSLCAERKLDSDSRARPVPPRALVRSGSARHQERS